MNTIEDVIRWIDLNGIEFWKVSKSRGDKNDKVFETEKEESMTEKKARFKDVLKLYPGNYFIVQGRKSYTQTTGNFEYEFMNGGLSTPSVTGINPAVSGDYVAKSEIGSLINEAIEKERLKTKMADLEAENKELKSQVNSAMTGIGNAINKIMPVLADRIFPPRPAVQLAGLERVPNEHQPENETENAEHEIISEATDEENNRINSALEKWAGADAEFIQVLEFIADFAATGKTISPFPMVTLDYNSIKGMLK